MGRPEHNKVTQISANPFRRVRKLLLDFTDPIAAGARKQIDLFSPPGYISRVINLSFFYNPVAGATLGTITVSINSYANLVNFVSVMEGTTSFDKTVFYRYCRFDDTVVNQEPTDKTAQILIVDKCRFDDLAPLSFVFMNNTDSPDGGSYKALTLTIEDEKVGG